MNIELYDYQIDAVNHIRNGNILCGGVGTGKSRTALYYYFVKVCGGEVKLNGVGNYKPMKDKRKLVIITTAKKRDSHEWEHECMRFMLDRDKDFIVDSWNNIKKYRDVVGAFFIFDEQRVVGSGTWVKSFLDIARKNKWILLSATPGDKWSDYIPVFVANKFYKNKTEFNRLHTKFRWTGKYYAIEGYVYEDYLEKLRKSILVPMNGKKESVRHDEWINCTYDRKMYKELIRYRFDPYTGEPVDETGKLFYLMRKIVNSDLSRIEALRILLQGHKRAIIFYNFTYECELIEKLISDIGRSYAVWNGKRHESLPIGEEWVYIVQYGAGSEGWNCISTDTIIFYSQTYSYRILEQAHGRIDRVNTPYHDLYYYHLKSNAPIDSAIFRALQNKKNFNERSSRV